jgi:integrase
MRTCEDYDGLEASPCTGVRVPVGEPERPARVLTPQEADAIIRAAYADDERLQRSFAGPLIRLAFGTGLRLGELLALRWEPRVTLAWSARRRSLDRVRGRRHVSDRASEVTRNRRDMRAQVATATHWRNLASDDRLSERSSLTWTGSASPSPATRLPSRLLRAGVFLESAPAEPRSSYAAFQRRCRELAISEPLPRFHDTRHAWATHMLAAGLSAHAVAELGGWSDAGLVWRRYGHALPDEVARAADALESFRASAIGA